MINGTTPVNGLLRLSFMRMEVPFVSDNKDRATEKAFEDLTANIAEKILKEMEK
jgi:hypothetical protein